MNPELSRREMLALAAPTAFVTAGLGGVALAADHAGHDSAVMASFKAAHDGTLYTLPPLPYDYDALEPHIDAQTMRLHHDLHHQGYVNGINRTIAAVREMSGSGEIDGNKLSALQRNLSFHGGGHVMHTVFWATMGPNGGGPATGPIADAIAAQYGSFDGFKAYFKAAAMGVKGSGWAVLAYEPLGGNLITFSMNDQDTKTMAGSIPLLPVDVWEHAYYLKYQNRRSEYVDAWFNTINWDAVNAIYSMSAKPRG
ncbi:MAG: superoxide dismutase [Planctomycetota bacterium]